VRPFRYVRAALAEPRTRLPRYLRTAVLRVVPRAPIAPPTPEWPLPPRQVRVADAGWKAFHAYRPGPYAGTATFFHAEVREPGLCDPLPVWQRAVQGGLTVEYIPGPHLDAMEEPTVSLIAERLSAHLEALGA
jgi:thioesterase domain-containing protein